MANEPRLPVKIVLNPTEETPTYHLNYAEVANNQGEFAVIGIWVPTKPSADIVAKAREGGDLVLSPAVQIVFPPHVAVGLRGAIDKQIELYERQHGKIRHGTQDQD